MLLMFKQLSRRDRNKVKTTDRNVTDYICEEQSPCISSQIGSQTKIANQF